MTATEKKWRPREPFWSTNYQKDTVIVFRLIKDREKLETKKTISFTFLPENTKHTSYQISSLVLKQRHLVLEDLPLASRHQL